MFLPPANEVWGKVIFSAAYVKNSVHRGSIWAGTPPWTGNPPPPGQVHPQAGTPPSQVHTPWQGTPPWVGTPLGAVHAGRYGQQAGGTHPTGMYSCYIGVIKLTYRYNVTKGEKFHVFMSV